MERRSCLRDRRQEEWRTLCTSCPSVVVKRGKCSRCRDFSTDSTFSGWLAVDCCTGLEPSGLDRTQLEDREGYGRSRSQRMAISSAYRKRSPWALVTKHFHRLMLPGAA